MQQGKTALYKKASYILKQVKKLRKKQIPKNSEAEEQINAYSIYIV